jgi:hypothetical protein
MELPLWVETNMSENNTYIYMETGKNQGMANKRNPISTTYTLTGYSLGKWRMRYSRR